jgi:eukaryotic-like serine/threonine-protein kinase
VSLQPGTRLGPYEILSPLGAGGMGEVYRARDAKLGRDVAIKVLPPAFATDPERLARFEREAQAVAALSHPNILAIFDFGEQEGTAYAVTELLEGETLRDRLETGPMSVRKAAELAVQMARGLGAAHDKGIVHRDLKPENVFVTKDGHVKILDFGLARVGGPVQGDSGKTMTTPPEGATGPGVVLGTVGYMSPEQVRGNPADHRSDLFSLGTVLYEMVSGRRAFQRDTAAESMTAILKEEPPEFQSVGKPVPQALDRVVRRCLEKNPEERFQSARDLAFALEDMAPGSGSAVPITAPFAPRHLRVTLIWAGLGALFVLGAGAAGWFLRTPPAPPSFVPLTHERGTVGGARFVPGTSEVVYSASWAGQPEQWYTRRIDQPSVRPIAGGLGPLLALSREGEGMGLSQAFVSHGQLTGQLYSLPTSGGSPRVLSEEQSWGGDQGGRPGDVACILGSYGGEIRIDWPLGHTVYRCQNTLRFLRIRGDHLVAFQEKQGNVEEGNLVLVDRRGKSRELATVLGFTGLAWGPREDEVWVSSYQRGQSRIVAADLKGGQRVLLQHAGRLELQDVNPEGSVLAALHTFQRQTFGRRSGETVDRDLGWLDAQATSGMSSDGAQVLLAHIGDWSLTEGPLYVGSIGGGAPRRLDVEGHLQPWLSADGRWVVTVSGEPNSSMVVTPTGPGTSRTYALPGVEPGDISAQLSPDGRTAFLWARRNHPLFMLFALDLASGVVRQISKEGVTVFLNQSWISPDGRRLACADVSLSPAGGGSPILVYGTSGGEPKTFDWLQRGEAIASWGADSESLVVWDRNRVPARVEKLDLTTGHRTPLLEIAPPDPAGVSGIQGIFVATDEKTYAYNVVRKLSELYLIEGLK